MQETETWVWFLGQEDPLEEEDMATYSSILAWKIPWTKQPGRLQSMESQRIGHDWATECSHTHTNINIPHLFYPFLCWYLGYGLSVLMQWTLECVYLFRLWFSPDIWPRVRLLNHRNSSEFSLSKLHPVLHNGCTNLHSSQQCVCVCGGAGGGVPFYSHPFQPFIVGRLLVKAILTGVRWYLIVVLICISDN